MVASSRLATRDDITRLLGLEHVYELEHTYGVAAGQSVDGQGHHERRTLASPQYGSRGDCVGALLGRTPQPTALKIFQQPCPCAASNTCPGLMLNRWFWYTA
jgi:lipid-binding SYLF domain-containing protein